MIMKNLSDYSNLLTIILGFLVITSCAHSHESKSHDHSDVSESVISENHNDEEVHLTRMQIDNVNIEIGDLIDRNINEVVNVNGYTKLAPNHQADISVPIPLTVQEIYVIEGEEVRKGEIIAIAESIEYDSYLLKIAELNEKLGIAKETLDFLQKEYDRQSKLSEAKISAKKNLEEISSKRRSEELKIRSVENQIQILKKTIAKVPVNENGNILIKSPIGGFITDVNIKIGSVVNPGQILISIVDNRQMHVDLLVYEKDLQKIDIGQKVRFSLTNQSNKEISGEIYNIGKSFESDTKSIAVHADIKSRGSNLIPGMYVNAIIEVGSDIVQSLPKEAIVRSQGREFIFIVDKNEFMNPDLVEYEFKKIEVRTGASQFGFIEVKLMQQIPINSQIVVEGSYYLQSHLQKLQGAGGHEH